MELSQTHANLDIMVQHKMWPEGRTWCQGRLLETSCALGEHIPNINVRILHTLGSVIIKSGVMVPLFIISQLGILLESYKIT